MAGARVLGFPLGPASDFDVSGQGWRLCYRAEPPRQDRAYGAYVLTGPASAGEAVRVRAQYRAGLSQDPLFFVIDRHPDPARLERAARACGLGGPVVDGAARIVDGSRNNYPEDTGRWSVSQVY